MAEICSGTNETLDIAVEYVHFRESNLRKRLLPGINQCFCVCKILRKILNGTNTVLTLKNCTFPVSRISPKSAYPFSVTNNSALLYSFFIRTSTLRKPLRHNLNSRVYLRTFLVIAGNIVNKKSRTSNKGWYCSFGVGRKVKPFHSKDTKVL
jgi:hypothetical protein